MKTVILVPRRAGIEDRDRIWAFARTWWENDHPDWPIIEGHHNEGPFNRAAAVNSAADAAGDWDVAVIIDADVLADPHATRNAATIAHKTGQPVLGYDERVHLNRAGTEKVLAGYTGNWKARAFVQATMTDACSGLVAVSRDLWDDVGGFDPLFSGWGWEDVAFRCAVETARDAQLIILSSTVFHLHHRVSHENNRREATFEANRQRGERYKAARFNPAAMAELLEDAARARAGLPVAAQPVQQGETRIPRILHRTVPAVTTPQVELWWSRFEALHPGWKFMTHRDPLDPAGWPMTGDLWDRCTSGAQKAGLIRLEALWRWGGVYVDSDVEPYRDLEPLLQLPAFAAWEDAKVVPDAVLGCEPQHPAWDLMIARARAAVGGGAKAWESGPGVTTAILPGRPDVLLLPPGAFFPYHYSEKATRASEDHAAAQPWAFAAHHWHHSWAGR